MPAEWLVEEGIGLHRAVLIEDGAIAAVLTEDPDEALPLGRIADARVGAPLPAGGRVRVTIDGRDAVLRGPPGAPEGATVRVEVVREATPERGNPKPPQVRLAAADAVPRMPAALAERLAQGDVPVTRLPRHGPDRLEAAGWGELIEQARTGIVPFPGGLLRIALTPAMTVIDVDGMLPPGALAVAGAKAAAAAIRRFDIGGSIGVDLPSAGDRGARQAAAAAFDRVLQPPFERTAVNGFGFIQIVRPRLRPSLLERVQSDAVGTAALELLRQAERMDPPGAAMLSAAPPVIARIAANPAWLDELARRRGGAVRLHADGALAISGAHAQPLRLT